MLRLATIGGFAFLGLILLGGQAPAQKKETPAKDDSRATAKDYKQLENSRELVGKLAGIDLNRLTVTLRIESSRVEPNPNYKGPLNPAQYSAELQRLQKQQQQAQAITNTSERDRRLQLISKQLQQLQSRYPAFKVIRDGKDFELPCIEKLEIRKLNLDIEYDDKGNVKKYTKEEMAELRGRDPNKPGYKAKPEELLNGQIVSLTLGPPRKLETKESPKKDDTGTQASKKEDKQADVANVPRPTVRMIVILQSTPDPISPTPPPRAK